MRIFCSGIGGIGLSAYAALQKNAGHDVCGSDRAESALLDDLQEQGIVVTTDQSGKAIPTDCELLVYSEAIPADAPERVEAAKRGLRQLSYPQALGELSQNQRVIAVCGTHGKSSTTAMAARLLMEAGMDPTVVVGTKLRELGGRNWRKGKSDIFLLEACEYRKSFHCYSPSVVLLTNVDGDHFDYYSDITAYRQSFIDFIKRLSAKGVLITHMQDQDCRQVAEAASVPVTDADAFPLIALQTPGLHMRQNAQLALALGARVGIDSQKAQKIVSGYAGSWRRLEERGMLHGSIPVIDDYAHHPREIRATLAALREKYPSRRIVTVFQPHTHDRTLKLYDDFVAAFIDADLVIVTDVYEARKDIETQKVDMRDFALDIAKKSGVETRYGGSLQDVGESLPPACTDADLVACLGAGDITALAGQLCAH